MGNSLTKSLNDDSFTPRRIHLSPTVTIKKNEEKSEQRAKIASAVAYLSVAGVLMFKDNRCVGTMGENLKKEMCFFVTQFTRPDTAPAKALAWVDMSLPPNNVSRSNQMKLNDVVVEVENELQSSGKCVTHDECFTGSSRNENSAASGESDQLEDQGKDGVTVHEEVCRSIDIPSLDVNTSSSEVELESANQIYQLAPEVRQNQKNEEDPENSNSRIVSASDDNVEDDEEDAVPRLDHNNNIIEFHLLEFSQSNQKSTKSQRTSSMSTAKYSSKTSLTQDNESDINILRKLAVEVREEIEKTLKVSPKHQSELLSSSNQSNGTNDIDVFSAKNGPLTTKPSMGEESYAASQSQNETGFSSDDDNTEIFKLKRKVMETQLNKPKKRSEASGTTSPSSSGDSGRRAPFAVRRRSSGDVTCRPGYRGIRHLVTCTPKARVQRPSGYVPSQSSSKQEPLISPLRPAYPRNEYTRSGYRGFCRH